jgi:hypothetical protein
VIVAALALSLKSRRGEELEGSKLPVHIAQVRTYLKLSGLKVGLLINFNVSRISDGIHRILHSDLSTPLARIKKEADERSLLRG